jgi:hypothetical protein
MFDGVVAAFAQDCRDRPQRLALRSGERESLEIIRCLHQRRRIPREGERAGDVAKAGVFFAAETGRRLGNEAVERPQPLEPLAGIVHRFVRAGRLVTKDDYRVFDQFQPGTADFIVEGFFRINPEGHPSSLRADCPWRATGWKSAGRP